MKITDIAKLAGVSTSAVSRYLNDGYVSEEKKKAIREVIEKTGYEPSKQAQIMRTKKSKVIGVIVPKISSESISRIVAGISEVLVQQNYQMLLANTENDTNKEIEYLKLLSKNPVDGIIFVATIFQSKHHAILKNLKIPFIIVSQKYETYPCIYYDDYNSARELTRRMINKGRKNPVCICVTDKDQAAGHNRTSGFIDALKEADIDLALMRIAESDFAMETGYDKMKVLYSNNPELDAVFCATDSIAVGAMEYLKELGKKIPKEISICGVGATKLSQVIEPRLTTVRLHYKSSGREAAKMLLEMLENHIFLSKQIKLGYDIIEGESI